MITLLAAISSAAFAQNSKYFPGPWSIDEALELSKQDLQTLRQRFPVLESASDLSKILISTSFKTSSSDLRVEWTGDKWMIKGTKVLAISRVDFYSAPLAVQGNLKNATAKWVGQIHTAEILKKVQLEVDNFLKQSGYRNARSTVDALNEGDTIRYTVKIDIGVPCVIKGYLWPDPIPKIRLPLLENGDVCDESAAALSVDEIEQKLHEQGWVNASLQFESFITENNETSAIVKVTGVIGNKVEYEFFDSNGASATYVFNTEEIKLMEPKITGPDAISYELVHKLKNRGYIDATIVGPEITQTSTGTTIYKFVVTPGQLVRVQSIKIEGNQFFESNELLSLLKFDSAGLGDQEKKSPIYSPDSIAEGLEEIKGNYVKAGFWDVKIVERATQTGNADQPNMAVVIGIEEGRQKIFEKIEFEGNFNIEMDSLQEHWKIEKGGSFDRTEILNFQQQVRSDYAALGYFYTTISADLISRSTGVQAESITIKFTINEGPRVKFGDVFVAGLIKTHANVATREVLFEAGDWYDPDLVLASRKAIMRLGVFSSVVIAPLDPVALSNRSEILDMLIEVKESPSRTVTFGPGWSSYYGMRYNVEGALTNIGGTGRQLYSRASFDQEKSQFAIGPRTLLGRSISTGYLEPHLLDYPIDGTISLSQAAKSTDYAWALTRGSEMEISHTLRRFLPGSRVSGFYGRKLNEEESSEAAKDAFLADTFSVGRVGIRLNIDHRDDLTWPTKGQTFTTDLSWARYELGGDLRYFRWEVSSNQYLSIFDDLVFAFGASFSAFQEVTRKNDESGDILPASERLKAGGVESVRGFSEGKLGPIVRRPDVSGPNNQWNCGFTNSPSGGSRRTLLKAELRYRWTSSFATTAFTDSGNTSFSADEMEKFEKAFTGQVPVTSDTGCPKEPIRSVEDNIGYEASDLLGNPQYIWDKHYTSSGLSFNFLTPIGSINLAYGVPWHEPKTDLCKENPSKCYSRIPVTDIWWKKGEIHFNVGARF